MSLFDVLKYTGTNLDSEEELSKLPIELFRLYQSAAYEHYGLQDSLCRVLKDPLSTQIRYLAAKWNADSYVSYVSKQLIFNKVLKEYNNDYI